MDNFLLFLFVACKGVPRTGNEANLRKVCRKGGRIGEGGSIHVGGADVILRIAQRSLNNQTPVLVRYYVNALFAHVHVVLCLIQLGDVKCFHMYLHEIAERSTIYNCQNPTLNK